MKTLPSNKCQVIIHRGLLRWLSGKESACQCWSHRRCKFDPWFRKISWRRKWQLTPVFLSGGSHGQRSLAVYSPWGPKELDMTERVNSDNKANLRICRMKIGKELPGRVAVRIKEVDEGKSEKCRYIIIVVVIVSSSSCSLYLANSPS